VELQDATLSGALMRECVLTETFDAIRAVAISRSGQYWAAASQRGEVRVWREAGQTLQMVWQAHTDMVTSLAFSPDERTLASGSRRRRGRRTACRRWWGIATGCGNWPLPPMAAGWPARAGMAPSSCGRWERCQATACPRRWWGTRSRCKPWPGARMEARWPVA